jgi:hypothetical protein
MDSNLNHRHVQVRSAELHRQAELHRHSAELHRKAELHRLATRARADRKAKPQQRPTIRVPSPVTGFRWLAGRVTAAVRAGD